LTPILLQTIDDGSAGKCPTRTIHGFLGRRWGAPSVRTLPLSWRQRLPRGPRPLWSVDLGVRAPGRRETSTPPCSRLEWQGSVQHRSSWQTLRWLGAPARCWS